MELEKMFSVTYTAIRHQMHNRALMLIVGELE